MTDDLATLPWYPDDERTPNGAVGRKPCKRHEWIETFTDPPTSTSLFVKPKCARCGAIHDDTRVRRGHLRWRAHRGSTRRAESLGR